MANTIISEFKSDFFSYQHVLTDSPTLSGLGHVEIHEHYEINYIISGNISYYVEGQEYMPKKGDVLIINSYELHRPEFKSPVPYERIVIYINPKYVIPFHTADFNLLHCFERRKLGHDNLISTAELNADIWKHYQKLEHYITYNLPESTIMLQLVIIELLVKLNKIFGEEECRINSSVHFDPKTLAIIEYINRHLNENITLELLSKEFFINKYSLCHAFKKNTGFTIIEYILNKRIMKAKELFAQGVNITEACYQVGFNNYSNFYKAFTQVMGVSPKQFIANRSS